MDLQEFKWLRAHAHKLDKELRNEVINQYRSLTRIPCFLQRFFRPFYEGWRKVPVIVQAAPLRDGEGASEVAFLLAQKTKNITELSLIRGYSGQLSLQTIKELAAHPHVEKIYLDREVRALLDVAVPTIGAQHVWQLGFTGKGVTIAVLDTGIYPHPDFLQPTNRILAFKDLVAFKDSTPYDDNGHGTHCAGVALGNGYSSSGKYRGPAFQANLIGIKVLNKIGSGNASQVIRGLEWCLVNKERYHIKIVSLSLGYKATSSYRDDPLCHAVEKLWQQGIVVCAAAGNEGPEARTINSPGIHPAIITVGAINDRNTDQATDDLVADFSSRGPTPDGLTKPDLLAPGANIIAPRAKGSYLDVTNKKAAVDDWYLSLSGTSMATPLCAGLVAQVLEANPRLSPASIKELLQSHSVKMAEADPNSQGAGYINAFATLHGISNLYKRQD